MPVLNAQDCHRLTSMSGAAKSNVLLFLAAMFAFLTLWLAIAAFGGPSVAYAVGAVVMAGATVVSFRAYRRLLRELDAEERRGQAPRRT